MRSPAAPTRRLPSTSSSRPAASRFTSRNCCSVAARSRSVHVLYLAANGNLHLMDEPRLAETTERHKIALRPAQAGLGGKPLAVLESDATLEGIVIEMRAGWMALRDLRTSRAALRLRRRVWVYWPGEEAVECIDRERLASGWRHLVAITVGWCVLGLRHAAARARGTVRSYVRAARTARAGMPWWSMPGWALRAVSRRLRAALSPASR